MEATENGQDGRVESMESNAARNQTFLAMEIQLQALLLHRSSDRLIQSGMKQGQAKITILVNMVLGGVVRILSVGEWLMCTLEICIHL
jgi:hypothetical protein